MTGDNKYWNYTRSKLVDRNTEWLRAEVRRCIDVGQSRRRIAMTLDLAEAHVADFAHSTRTKETKDRFEQLRQQADHLDATDAAGDENEFE